MPHAGVEEMLSVLSTLDARIASIPEVEWSVGKAGRAESALDPAPLSMVETIIQYHSEYILDENRNQKLFKYNEIKSLFERDRDGNLIQDDRGKPLEFGAIRSNQRGIYDEIVKVCTIPGTTSAPFTAH